MSVGGTVIYEKIGSPSTRVDVRIASLFDIRHSPSRQMESIENISCCDAVGVIILVVSCCDAGYLIFKRNFVASSPKQLLKLYSSVSRCRNL